MPLRRSRAVWAAVATLAVCIGAGEGAEPIHYTFRFPEPQHRWMEVEATFPEIDESPLELHISRSSPGRYSMHDFAKNVYDVSAAGPDGRALAVTRTDPSIWVVATHGASVIVKYKVFGDRIDGTYLAVDETHAHINMPAAIMWAKGLDDRPATLSFERPAGVDWRVATQLHGAGSGPFVFSAPNLQYLMDSPVEFGPVIVRQFMVDDRTFRFAVHHTGSDADVDGLVRDVQTIVREEGAVYGEYPAYEPGAYTFLADYLPHARGDGMEHRNSTVMTSPSSIAGYRADLLQTVAHEFFHCWNVERIRPRGLEPFDLDRANLTGELWLAEGFTQYYGPLVLARSGLLTVDQTAGELTTLVDAVVSGPGRLARSAEEMSQMAAFIDGGQPVDRTNWSRTVISYYPFGGAIALALDLSLRERTSGKVTLDDFMREMWIRYGKPGGTREGYVDHPYTSADAERVLGMVAGDDAFAREFFARYIRGHEAADYGRLLNLAGFAVRKAHPGSAWIGDVGFRSGSPELAGVVAPNWPLYAAGLDQDDEIQRIDGRRVETSSDVAAAMAARRPGERVDVVFADRTGRTKTATVTLAENPHVVVVPVESAGGRPTEMQRVFRTRWLESKR